MDLVDAGSVINNFRENLEEYKERDAAGKEKIAETARNILKIEADYAEKMRKLSPRDGKKLKRKVDQDEAILVRFLTDLGVGRHSPENQKCIDKLEEEIAVLIEQIKYECQESREKHHHKPINRETLPDIRCPINITHAD